MSLYHSFFKKGSTLKEETKEMRSENKIKGKNQTDIYTHIYILYAYLELVVNGVGLGHH